MRVGIKKAFSKKRLFAVLIIFVAVAVMVASNPEVRHFFTNTEAVKLDFQTGIEHDMVTYGKTMLLINNEGISAVDKSGREAWSIVAPATVPNVEVCGDYIMLADINGKTVKTFEKEKNIAQISTENEILCAKVNKNGYVAVATSELGYKGLVILFDKHGKEMFKWHSGSGYIGDIDVSADKRLAVAQIVTDREKVCSRILIINPGSDKEPECIAELDGIVMNVSYRSGGSLVAVSDKGLFGYKKSGKPDFSVSFEGRIPVEFNVKNERNMVFAFDSGLNGTLIESYSASGKLRGTYSSETEIKALDVNGECILAAETGRVLKLNPQGQVKKEMGISRDVQEVRIFADRDRFLSLGGNSIEIIKLR